jgi:hypothetical protein
LASSLRGPNPRLLVDRALAMKFDVFLVEIMCLTVAILGILLEGSRLVASLLLDPFFTIAWRATCKIVVRIGRCIGRASGLVLLARDM